MSLTHKIISDADPEEIEDARVFVAAMLDMWAAMGCDMSALIAVMAQTVNEIAEQAGERLQ